MRTMPFPGPETAANSSVEPPLRPLALALCAAGLLCVTTVPCAQESAPPAADAGLAEPANTVIITAGKRRQAQREVAGSVSVAQGDMLEQQGARDQEDVFRQIPGVQFNKQDPGRAVPTIRGVGTAPNASLLGQQQASTGIYVEDVPFTDPFVFMGSGDIAPFDLERVEVLRGPQGALYGSSSLGGAVRYLFNKPDLAASQFSVLASSTAVANGGAGGALYAMANVPLVSERAGMRLVAFDRHDSGYIDNTGTGTSRANALHQRGARALLRLRPASEVQVNGTLSRQETRIDDGFSVASPARAQFSSPTASPRHSTVDFANLQIDASMGPYTLSANSGAYRKGNHGSNDMTRYFQPLFAPYGLSGAYTNPYRQRSSAVSQELRLASNGLDAFSFVTGVFFQRTQFHQEDTTRSLGVPAAPSLLPGAILGSNSIAARATESALFADGEYVLGSGWSTGLGGRLYHTRLDYSMQTIYSPLLGGANVNIQPGTSDRGITPKFTVKYRFGDQQWYVLASKGYRFGGVNFNPPVMSRYQSDALWNLETGLRLAPARNVKLDISLFHLDWRQAQVSALIPAIPAPVLGTANVGRARSRGAEVALDWRPLPPLSLGFNLAYTDARTTAPYTAASGGLVPVGARLPGTARLQSALHATYSMDGPWGSTARLSASHAYVGARVFDIEGRGAAPGYAQTDLRAGFERDNWTLALYANNLGNRHGVAGATAGANLAFVDYYLIQPRTAGMSLRYDY